MQKCTRQILITGCLVSFLVAFWRRLSGFLEFDCFLADHSRFLELWHFSDLSGGVLTRRFLARAIVSGFLLPFCFSFARSLPHNPCPAFYFLLSVFLAFCNRPAFWLSGIPRLSGFLCFHLFVRLSGFLQLCRFLAIPIFCFFAFWLTTFLAFCFLIILYPFWLSGIWCFLATFSSLSVSFWLSCFGCSISGFRVVLWILSFFCLSPLASPLIPSLFVHFLLKLPLQMLFRHASILA